MALCNIVKFEEVSEERAAFFMRNTSASSCAVGIIKQRKAVLVYPDDGCSRLF
jgi:hypothetical protein